MKWGLFFISIGCLSIGVSPLFEGALATGSIIQGLILIGLGVIVMVYIKQRAKVRKKEGIVEVDEDLVNKQKADERKLRMNANIEIQKQLSDEKNRNKKWEG